MFVIKKAELYIVHIRVRIQQKHQQQLGNIANEKHHHEFDKIFYPFFVAFERPRAIQDKTAQKPHGITDKIRNADSFGRSIGFIAYSINQVHHNPYNDESRQGVYHPNRSVLYHLNQQWFFCHQFLYNSF
jgi:hypothetical protein